MKKRRKIILPILIGFLIMIMAGLAACSDNYLSGNGITSSSPKNVSSRTRPQIAPPIEPLNPMSYTIQISISDVNWNPEAHQAIQPAVQSPGLDNHLTLHVTKYSPHSVTGNLQISTGSATPSTDPLKMNPVYAAYQHTPESISYDGSPNLGYSLQNGTSGTVSLRQYQQIVMDSLRHDFNNIPSRIGGGGLVPAPSSANVSGGSKSEPHKSVKAMSSKQIEKMLKKSGYEVKKLDNHRFKLIRKYKHPKMRIITIIP